MKHPAPFGIVPHCGRGGIARDLRLCLWFSATKAWPQNHPANKSPASGKFCWICEYMRIVSTSSTTYATHHGPKTETRFDRARLV